MVGEGEKTANALAQLFPNCVATTSVCGAQSPDKSDWSPIAGRSVLIWPDNDKAGLQYARKVEAGLSKLGCVVEVVDVAALAAGAEGWDAADAVAECADLEELRKAVAEHTKEAEEEATSAIDAAVARLNRSFAFIEARPDSILQTDWRHPLKSASRVLPIKDFHTLLANDQIETGP
jgi:DNA primase